MTPVLTDAQLSKFHTDGFVVLPKFASEEACLALRERAMQLAKEYVPSPEQATIFTADSNAKHAADEYFLSSGDKIRCFFEKDAFDATGALRNLATQCTTWIPSSAHSAIPKNSLQLLSRLE
jgi:phytanoyl-CoA hydroxylase